MARFPEVGKIDRGFFDRVIFPRLGAKRREVVQGPKHGLDVAVVKMGGGLVMVATTDPLSIIPALGLKDSAWLSVHLLASDLTTSGLPPAYAMLDFNLPLEITGSEFGVYWEAMHREFRRLGVAVIAGHTGRYAGCGYTLVGGGSLLAVGPEDRYVCADMARPGDSVIVTKGAAIAATGILSRVFPDVIERRYGRAFLRRAQRFFHRFSTVEDALTAASVGVRGRGVTAMHDATEGGVLASLCELAEASGHGITVKKNLIPFSMEAKIVCQLFGLDPYAALSEGTLVVAVRPESAAKVVKRLGAKGIDSAVVGKVTPKRSGMWLDEEGVKKPLVHPGMDPYWRSFSDAIQKGWK